MYSFLAKSLTIIMMTDDSTRCFHTNEQAVWVYAHLP